MIDNVNAIRGIKQILLKFTNQEVISLCGTVTQGLLKNKIHTRDGAVDAVIKYSADSSSLLKRKAITRNHLFDYLHEAGIEVTLPITKEELVEAILQYWNETTTRSNHTPSSISHASSSNNSSHTSLEQTQISITSDANVPSNYISTSEFEIMALQFSEWFYSLMNKNELIDTEHFYPDATIQISLINDQVTVNHEAINNVNEVVSLLFRIKQEHSLYFNPNLHKEGTRARMDSHGLVIIMSCGTLHINNVISGVFEQVFGLARDPFSQNNWKIKTSKLILRSTHNVDAMPRLSSGDGDDTMLQIKEI